MVITPPPPILPLFTTFWDESVILQHQIADNKLWLLHYLGMKG